jgi:hypothetical protein
MQLFYTSIVATTSVTSLCVCVSVCVRERVTLEKLHKGYFFSAEEEHASWASFRQ